MLDLRWGSQWRNWAGAKDRCCLPRDSNLQSPEAKSPGEILRLVVEAVSYIETIYDLEDALDSEDNETLVRVMGPCGNHFRLVGAALDEDGVFVLEFE